MINWEQRTITGISGRIYKIQPEMISSKRFREYEIMSLVLAFSTDFHTYYKELVEIKKKLVELVGKHDGQKLLDLANKTDNLIQGIDYFTKNSVPKLHRFCATFCTYEGEDITKFEDEMLKEKSDDWGAIPYADFFLLVSELIPSFGDVYRLRNTKELIK